MTPKEILTWFDARFGEVETELGKDFPVHSPSEYKDFLRLAMAETLRGLALKCTIEGTGEYVLGFGAANCRWSDIIQHKIKEIESL